MYKRKISKTNGKKANIKKKYEEKSVEVMSGRSVNR